MACSAYKWVELVPPNIKFLLSANKSGHSLLPLGGNGQISLQFRTMPNCLVVGFFFKNTGNTALPDGPLSNSYNCTPYVK